MFFVPHAYTLYASEVYAWEKKQQAFTVKVFTLKAKKKKKKKIFKWNQQKEIEFHIDN